MKKLLVILTILVLSIIGVSATADITYTAENLQNFNALAYNCANEDCSQVTDFSGSFPASTSNGQLEIVFPTEQSQYGYAVYFTSPGYLPKVVKATWYGDGATTRSFQFDKGDVCRAKIDEFTVTNDAVENVPLTIITEASLDATTESAFSLTNHPVKYVPPSLAEYYSSDIKVTMTITDTSGNVVKTQSQDLKVMAGESKPVGFEWTPQQSGEYTITLSTEVTDNQCSSSEIQATGKRLTVYESAPRNACYTLMNGLTVDTSNGKLDWNINSVNSYHANDYLFFDSRYQLTQVPTTLDINVLNYEGQPYAVHSETQEVFNTASGSVDLAPGTYVLDVKGFADHALCDGLENTQEQLGIIFTIVAPKTYSASFELKDPSGTAVEGATVTFGGASTTTDSNGRTSYGSLQSGTYLYTITKEGFKDLNGQVDITDFDRSLGLTLEFTEPVENPQPPVESTYSVTFNLVDKSTGNAIEGVKVVIAQAVGYAGANGRITFQGLTNGKHDYSLAHSDYEARSDSVTVAGSDLSLTLELERVTGVTPDPDDNTPPTPKPNIKNQRRLVVSSVRIPAAFQARAGEELLLVINTANPNEEDLENVRASAVIQELGARGTSSVVDLDEGDRATQKINLKLPKNSPAGTYYVRVSLDSDHAHRVFYRAIEIA